MLPPSRYFAAFASCRAAAADAITPMPLPFSRHAIAADDIFASRRATPIDDFAAAFSADASCRHADTPMTESSRFDEDALRHAADAMFRAMPLCLPTPAMPRTGALLMVMPAMRRSHARSVAATLIDAARRRALIIRAYERYI